MEIGESAMTLQPHHMNILHGKANTGNITTLILRIKQIKTFERVQCNEENRFSDARSY